MVHEAFKLVQFVVLLELLDEDLVRYLSNRLIGVHQLLVHLLAYLLEHGGYSVSAGLTVARLLMLLGGQGVVRFLTVIIILIICAPVRFGKAW